MKSQLLFFGSMLFFFSSCGVQVPLATTNPANNTTYTIEYLFEHDGCKVYRFFDMGHYVYFTNCNNCTTSVVNDSVQINVIPTGTYNSLKK